MKMKCVVCLSASVLAVATFAEYAFGQAATSRPAVSPTSRPTALPSTNPAIAPEITAITTAPDASTVVAAYTKALAENPTNTAATVAYIRRMIDLGSPELAVAQAKSLTATDPNHGLAWAVLAGAEQKQGNYGQAIKYVVSAARNLPNDPFVQKNAGELFGWYASQQNKPALPADVVVAITNISETMGKYLAFTNAYNRATIAMRRTAVGNWQNVQAQSRLDTTTLAQPRRVTQPVYPSRPLPYYQPQYQPTPVTQNIPGYGGLFNFGRYNYLPNVVVVRPGGGERGGGGEGGEHD